MKFRLKIYQPQVDVVDFPIEETKSEIHIGRSGDNEITLRDTKVSRKHATFYFKKNALMIKDAGSSHGLFVNGVKIAEAELKAGDKINLGETSILVESEGGAEAKKEAKEKPAKEAKKVTVTGGNRKPLGKKLILLLIAGALVAGGFHFKKETLSLYKLVRKTLFDDSKERFEAAYGLLEKGEFEEAAKRFKELIKDDKTVADFYLCLGLAQKGMGQFRESIEAFQRAAELDPKWYEPYYHLGDVYLSIRDYANGIPAIEKAIAIDNADPESHYYLCIAYFETDKVELAEKECGTTLKLDPTHIDAKDIMDEIAAKKAFATEEDVAY
jgi:pSer/pThr/pTyr-binding forkhead associated (FHA) protein